MAWPPGPPHAGWGELECAALVGEDQPLCPDLPELDLSELDVNDLEDSGFLGGLKWYSDQSEIISHPYPNETSNIFEKIDEENEANLLAVLTETLDSIPVDEDGLPSFDALTDGDVTSQNEASPSSVADSTPPPQEAEETSLTENPWSNKVKSICQAQKPQRRPCSELLKYLTTGDDPGQAKQTENRNSNRDKYSSKKKALLHSQTHHLQENECYGAPAKQTKSMNLSLPLTPESPNDPKGSPFESKAIGQSLSVELCGTAGLTPPTTPPHKSSQDNPFGTLPKPTVSCQTVMPPSPKPRCSDSSISQGRNLFWKGPEQSELYAQLSKTSVLPGGREERKARRAGLPLFGDHDYCQSAISKTERCVNRSLELQNPHQEFEFSGCLSGYEWCHICSSFEQNRQEDERETSQARKQDLPCNSRKQLQDQEIRAELNKHFGYPSQAVLEEEMNNTSHLREYSHYSDEQFSKLSMFINSGLAMEGFWDDDEAENEKLCCSWYGTQGCTLFDTSPSCSSQNSPCRDLESPPNSFAQRFQRLCAQSRSFPQCRHCAHSPYSRSRSRSPGKRCSSRYDSYEEYQHERLKREEYRKEYEKRESERAKQRERERQKAVEERRVIYIGRIGPGFTRRQLRDRFEVFGEIEDCTMNLQDDGDSYGFITYRYTCDAFAALENGNTLRRSNEPAFQLYFCGQRQRCKANYADLDSDDFDPASTKSKYDSMDFDSLLREAQGSFRR
ncbi:peroxisome proliferator-activated receptor gamma coactivator 1-alpha isoform X2 [Crotalus tigris]|uniref:peroxisome proliferator-activated receptor gamma coactivator 1-alpha isoform X2 n=1 Tax=Crotalus tigris TaxID=88082 RepID=UPI00192F5E66|nr:peroxisome proliferator-activated receptor gamma coactivator 1-alpha isoform X2 [Crotalus tigris]